MCDVCVPLEGDEAMSVIETPVAKKVRKIDLSRAGEYTDLS